MTDDQLSKLICSDESNFEVVNRKSKVLVRRLHTEKFDQRFVTPRLQRGGGSVGIWGCILADVNPKTQVERYSRKYFLKRS